MVADSRGLMRAGLGKLFKMFTPLAVGAATASYGSGSGAFTPVSAPDVLTVASLNTLAENGPMCVCSYFDPASTGDAFTIISSFLQALGLRRDVQCV